MIKRLKTVSVIIALLNCGLSLAGDKALTNTWSSPHVAFRCTDMNVDHWLLGCYEPASQFLDCQFCRQFYLSLNGI